MSRTTYNGALRQTGSNFRSANVDGATPAVFLAGIQFSQDPTAASAGTGKYLPKGAIPMGVQNIDGGATGGTNPTVDVGTSGDADGFANELDADGVTDIVSTTGALIGTELTVDTEIYAGVGASAATGGTVTLIVYYIMADDGARNTRTA